MCVFLRAAGRVGLSVVLAFFLLCIFLINIFLGFCNVRHGQFLSLKKHVIGRPKLGVDQLKDQDTKNVKWNKSCKSSKIIFLYYVLLALQDAWCI